MTKITGQQRAGYKHSSLNHVCRVKVGIIPLVDTKLPKLHHMMHLEYEQEKMNSTILNKKEKKLLRQHMKAHRLALRI